MEMIPARIELQDGTIFHGYVPPWQDGDCYGEFVFTTGMTGYPESLTDPSFTGQILTFTYPLIGNYGVSDSSHWESQKIHPKGVVVNEACEHWSHSQGKQALMDWLRRENVVLITGVDTRALAKHLRSRGSMPGVICARERLGPFTFEDPNLQNLVANVSIPSPKVYESGKPRVLLIDCGMKENILRSLLDLPITLVRVPFDYDFSNEDYDGIFISNGPGDPTQCTQTIQHLKIALGKGKPIFGICLGTQLLALAAGAKTYKLPFGHRGHNQPCIDTETKRCYITSQNHGYAIEESTLPTDWRVSFRNLNDGSVEGIAHKELPYFAVQFHPEAAPGPTDTHWLFEHFFHILSTKPTCSVSP